MNMKNRKALNHDYYVSWRNRNPGKYYLKMMHLRCNDPKKTYFRKGIKVRITEEEIERLWERDKGYLLKQPSVDRIDSEGDYTFENCRFIEFIENCRIRAVDRVNIVTGETIRFKSASEAARSIGASKFNVWAAANYGKQYFLHYWRFVDGRTIKRRRYRDTERTREENTLYFREYRLRKKIAPLVLPMLLLLRTADYRKGAALKA